MKKRTITLLLSLALALTLCACGSAKEESTPDAATTETSEEVKEEPVEETQEEPVEESAEEPEATTAEGWDDCLAAQYIPYPATSVDGGKLTNNTDSQTMLVIPEMPEEEVSAYITEIEPLFTDLYTSGADKISGVMEDGAYVDARLGEYSGKTSLVITVHK